MPRTQSPTTEAVSIETRNGYGTTLAAIVHLPSEFDTGTTHSAVVVSHTGGGVKEQTAGLYASKLAASGLVAVAYDASFQGESTGTPRQLENPHIRTEDISAVIDFLTTLPYLDNNQIGAMGICVGGGYSINAAINDPRIKAVGTVSMVNIGQMFRNGWDGSGADADAVSALAQGAGARIHDASSAERERYPLTPMRKQDAQNPEEEEIWEYYHTPRGAHPNAPGFMTTRSLNQIITYDAFHKAEVYLTQPLLLIAGSEDGSKWMTEDAHARAASTDKSLYLMDGANHMTLYDRQPYVNDAASKLAQFFADKL